MSDPNPVAPQAPVEVISGLAKGMRGIVEEKARVTFGDIPVWSVRFEPPLGLRCIREDYLRVLA